MQDDRTDAIFRGCTRGPEDHESSYGKTFQQTRP